MRKIFKIPLRRIKEFAIDIPEGGEFRGIVRDERDFPHICVEAEEKAKLTARVFRAIGAGEVLDVRDGKRLKWVGCYQSNHGKHAWHIYLEEDDF